ncbi:MAG: hypothetical protein GY854_10640 [Deltaproteobacteria bacterium]|nr:hypothetical protein [Deltaproteobacteria bacterium]
MMTDPRDNPMNLEAEKLLELLAQLRRRGQMLVTLRGTSWLLAGGSVLLLALITALGWWGGANLRALGWVGVGAGLVGLALAVLVIPLVHLRRPEAVARRIGQAFPNLASDMLSASQLATSPDASVFSEALVAGHLRSSHEALTSVSREQIYPVRSLIGPAVALALALAVLVCVYSTLPGVLETGLASLWWEPGPPEQTTRHVSAKAPVVGDLTLTLRYPEYLRRDERRLDAISGGLVAPLGTTVVLEGKSLVPGANKGTINLPGGGKSPLSVGVDGVVRGHFVVGAGGHFSVALDTGSLVMEGPERHLEVEVDSPPSIRLLRPVERVEVAEDGEIILELEAEDDHGLGRVDLILRAGSNVQMRKTIIRLADHLKRLKTQYRWTPESVRIGNETDIKIELVVYDDDSILGPKPGRSSPLDVRILTPLSRHKSVTHEQGETLDTLIDLLARRLESPVPSNRRGKEAKERFVMLRRETEDVLGRTARLIRALGQDTLTPRNVADAFIQIRQDLSNQILYEARLHGDALGDFRKRKGVDRVTTRLLETAVIRIDDLLIEQQLRRVVRAGGSLDRQRDELAKLLARFERTRAESARRALLEAIESLEESIKQLQRNMESIRGKVGDTYINPSSVIHMDLLGSLSELRSLLAEGDVGAAAHLVSRLKTDLGRLMAGLEGGLLSFRTERFGEGERFLGELLDRVMSIESDQLQLRRETTALRRRYQERLVAMMRGRIDSLVKQQLGRVRKMRRLTSKIDSPASESGRTRLVRLRLATRELKMALSQGDLDEARQLAREIADLAGEWTMKDKKKKTSGIRELKRLAEKLDAEVARAYPRPAQLLSTRDRRLTRIQATKQRLLLNHARKLRTWTGNQGEATRFLSHRASSALKAVAADMSRAIDALEAKRVRGAIEEQSSALDELARLREDLKRGDEVAPLDSRPVVLRGKVELPDPDDYEVPPEFREDILEAMHGDLPRKYKDAIKKYYETLVK